MEQPGHEIRIATIMLITILAFSGDQRNVKAPYRVRDDRQSYIVQGLCDDIPVQND